LQRQGPTLAKQRRALERSLVTIKTEADKVLTDWSSMDGQTGRAFLTEKLNELAQRRAELEQGLLEAERSLQALNQESVSAETVRAALGRFPEVYTCLKPFEQKELIHLVLRRAEVTDRQIVLEINGNVPAVLAGTSARSASRSVTPNWLPGLISQSALRDVFSIRLRSLAHWARRQSTGDRVGEWSRLLAERTVENRAELARKNGLSRARVTQILGSAQA